MSDDQQKYSRRYQSERLFRLKSSTQSINISDESFKRTGLMGTGQQPFHSRPANNSFFFRRQVYASRDCVSNLMLQEPEQPDPIQLKENKLRQKLCSLRRWEFTRIGNELHQRKIKHPPCSLNFTVLSYNVLAQHLLEEHTYLYRRADPEALVWEKRGERILREVKDTGADILCLQEVQSDHFHCFYVPKLRSMGFKGIFKKRTGDKPDGCAIFFRHSIFELKESKSVEYCKPNVQILDRDNIGLIALLTPRVLKSRNAVDQDLPFIVVATTHLLYNPKRHDIKLAQLQLLFAELDLLAFISSNVSSKSKSTQHVYHPTILTGDFNLTPDSSIYEFITRGSLQYKGLSRRELTPETRGQVLDSELIPPHLNVTDQCQHLGETEKRISRTVSDDASNSEMHSSKNGVEKFSTGQLSHQLKLLSAYPHRLNRLNGTNEATTYQNGWVTVDYIFHKYIFSYLTRQKCLIIIFFRSLQWYRP